MLVEVEDNLSSAISSELCKSLGKDCRECVCSSANVVASLCPTLDAAGAQVAFFQMYRHQSCVGMARRFVRDYLSAVEPQLELFDTAAA
ncbi:hypothetical protein [Bryobacter aggregatus]|uniref:hypothetical protein n=1 Tax=Bryobacter aggregatus TaxID=360054 RepID=UPI0004E106B7|nr:hypothetical protein [Bryobacter aggregatus]